MIKIVNDNLTLYIFLGICVISIVIAVLRNKEIKKKYIPQNEYFTKKEYSYYCKESENALSNTVISFIPERDDDAPVVDKYVRTLCFGAELMIKDKFSVSKVGKI